MKERTIQISKIGDAGYMNGKIAVYMQDQDELVSFYGATKIKVFEKGDAGWETIDEIDISKIKETEPALLRSGIERIIEKLDNCSVIAGGGLSGIAYNQFNKHGFDIFEISVCGSEVFEGIRSDLEDKNKEDALRLPSSPAETAAQGIYYLDLVSLQKQSPEISSKQALKDFLENTPFIELKLICGHVPPWLENGPYDISTEEIDNGKLLATIRKKQC